MKLFNTLTRSLAVSPHMVKVELIESLCGNLKGCIVDYETKEFERLMNNNLDTPKALKLIYDLAQKENQDSKQTALKIYQILGFKI